MAAKKDEVATVAEAPVIPRYDPSQYDLDSDWEKLAGESDEILGHALIKDDSLNRLENVPFIIHRVIYRPGANEQDFVTCEAIIAPMKVLKELEGKGRIPSVNNLSVYPGEHVVFNDSGTGIRRQITRYLYLRGFIGLPEPIIEDGRSGESSFDKPHTEWTFGAEAALKGLNVRISCPRGIKPSQYDIGFGDSETRYLG